MHVLIDWCSNIADSAWPRNSFMGWINFELTALLNWNYIYRLESFLSRWRIVGRKTPLSLISLKIVSDIDSLSASEYIWQEHENSWSMHFMKEVGDFVEALAEAHLISVACWPEFAVHQLVFYTLFYSSYMHNKRLRASLYAIWTFFCIIWRIYSRRRQGLGNVEDLFQPSSNMKPILLTDKYCKYLF